MATSQFSERIRKPLRALGFGVAQLNTTEDADVPLITSGTGVPTASDPNGSLWLRTSTGGLYARVASAWGLLATIGVAWAQTAGITTTQGVASGTARVVGGQAAVNSASATTITNIASETDASLTYSIPANTINAGTSVRIRVLARHPSTNSTDTFQLKVYVGSTVIHTTAAVDLANDDCTSIDCRLIGRAAAGAAASCEYGGQSLNKTTGAVTCAVGNFATNGALVVKVAVLHSVQSASNQTIVELVEVDLVG